MANLSNQRRTYIESFVIATAIVGLCFISAQTKNKPLKITVSLGTVLILTGQIDRLSKLASEDAQTKYENEIDVQRVIIQQFSQTFPDALQKTIGQLKKSDPRIKNSIDYKKIIDEIQKYCEENKESYKAIIQTKKANRRAVKWLSHKSLFLFSRKQITLSSLATETVKALPEEHLIYLVKFYPQTNEVAKKQLVADLITCLNLVIVSLEEGVDVRKVGGNGVLEEKLSYTKYNAIYRCSLYYINEKILEQKVESKKIDSEAKEVIRNCIEGLVELVSD
ncbi:MAG: hypothetical protein WBB82_09475 [Limnothrix sp.]